MREIKFRLIFMKWFPNPSRQSEQNGNEKISYWVPLNKNQTYSVPASSEKAPASESVNYEFLNFQTFYVFMLFIFDTFWDLEEISQPAEQLFGT